MVSKYISSKKPIFVAGGSKGVGIEVVKQLTSMGNPVKCLVRRQESVDELKAIGGGLVTCQVGDAMDESDAELHGRMHCCCNIARWQARDRRRQKG